MKLSHTNTGQTPNINVEIAIFRPTADKATLLDQTRYTSSGTRGIGERKTATKYKYAGPMTPARDEYKTNFGWLIKDICLYSNDSVEIGEDNISDSSLFMLGGSVAVLGTDVKMILHTPNDVLNVDNIRVPGHIYLTDSGQFEEPLIYSTPIDPTFSRHRGRVGERRELMQYPNTDFRVAWGEVS